MAGKNIVVLVRYLGRESGGVASIMDLIDALHSLGHKVNVGLDRQTLHHYKNVASKDFPMLVPPNQIFRIPKAFRLPEGSILTRLQNILRGLSKTEPNHLKRIIKYLFWLFFGFFRIGFNAIKEKWREPKNYKILAKAELIINSTVLNKQAIKLLRKASKAKILKNHAGSVELMESQWFKGYDVEDVPGQTKYETYMSSFDYVLFQSEEQAKVFEDKSPLLLGKSLVLKPSSHEQDIDRAKEKPSPYPSNQISILVIGTIQERKGQDLAIEAFEKLAETYPKMHLHFLGSGQLEYPFYPKVLKLVNQSPVKDRIHLHGYRKDYLDFMVHADIILQPSKAEGVSRILREAMYCKVPIIAFEISGTRELLRKNIDAFLVEPCSVDGLVDSIKVVIENPEKRNLIIENAFARYREQNSQEAFRKSLKTLVEQIA